MMQNGWLWLGVALASLGLCTVIPLKAQDRHRRMLYWVVLVPVSLVLIFYVYPAGIELFRRLAVGSP